MLNTAPNTYMNKGLIPNASKNRLHFLYPLMSMIQMSKANELAANPHVVRTNVGDHIFLLIGQPYSRSNPAKVSIVPAMKRFCMRTALSFVRMMSPPQKYADEYVAYRRYRTEQPLGVESQPVIVIHVVAS